MTIVLAVAATWIAFVISAAAGMGGSLLLVPVLALMFGAKAGIAMAAVLLCANNAAKVVAYRKSLPFRAALPILALTAVGSLLGAAFLRRATEGVVEVAVVIVIAGSFLTEHLLSVRARQPVGLLAAFGAGALSGFSGTSGPLKGVAIRSLGHDRSHLVGASSLVSLASDAVKAIALFSLIDFSSGSVDAVLAAGVLASPLTAFWGRAINRRLNERTYAWIFWSIMTGYVARLVVR